MTDILVIDDEPAVCEVLQTQLESAGYTVRTATSATNLPALLTPPPDVILLDVLMPEVNGLECLPELKTQAPNAYIVVITGVNDYRVADLFYEAGVDGFLTKPLHHQKLIDILQRLDEAPAKPPAPEIEF